MTYPPGVAGDRYVAPDTKEGSLAMLGGQLPHDTNACPASPDARSAAAGRTATPWLPLKKVASIAGNDLRNAVVGRDQ